MTDGNGDFRAPLSDLAAAVRAAAATVRGRYRGNGTTASEPLAQPRLERPKREGQGDYSTNAAMLLAPAPKSSPAVSTERNASRSH